METALSDTGDLLAEMTDRLFADRFDDAAMRAARCGAWPAGAWHAAIEQGLPRALVEGEQGYGVPLADGLALIRLIGRRAVPLPIAETMIANALLAHAGLSPIEDVVALVPEGGIRFEQRDGGWRATGQADRIAWGRNAAALLVEQDGRLALMTAGFRVIDEGANLAHMPRDRLAIDGDAQIVPLPGISLLEAGALVRAQQMAGALETLVSLTLSHVSERVQFGRALSGFQAVQHSLARLASEAAAGAAAADLAADAFAAASAETGIAIAAARARIGEAAGTAIGIAHQLHGAIGFTEEHRLHWFTTALWSWRDEFGSTAWWTRRLGVAVLAAPKSGFWPMVTSI